jgi:hypothetical protein
MNMFRFALPCLVAICLGVAHAAEPIGVLKKIKDSGQITLGYASRRSRSRTSTTRRSRSAIRSSCAGASSTP